jgi:hypothetical protein
MEDKKTLADRNNPLGQRVVSDQVGGPIPPTLKHGQSADLVDEVREKADEIQKNEHREDGKNPSAPQPGSYDRTGPDRQPGRVVKQSDLGKSERVLQEGQYTQDNEEEGPTV